MALSLHLLVRGAPLVADPDPNVTAPAPERRIVTPVRRGIATGGPVQIIGLLFDGTSINFTVWVRSDELGVWFKLGDTTNVSAARSGIVGGVPCEAEVFVQLTAPAGAPTRFGIAIGYGSSEVGVPEPDAWKQPVRLATVVALPACALVGNRLTAAANGTIPAATTDGFALAVGNDVLVKNQGGVAAHLQDGPYRVVDVGLAGGGGRPWILDRTPHCDESGEVFDGMMVVVGEGNTLKGHVFEQVTDAPIDLNVTALEFRDLGSLLALVTATTTGTVNAFGATDGQVLGSDGSTRGGVWRGFLKVFAASIAIGAGAVAAAGDVRIGTTWTLNGLQGAADHTVLFWTPGGLELGNLTEYLDLKFGDAGGVRIVSGAVAYFAASAGIASYSGGYKRTSTTVTHAMTPYPIVATDAVLHFDAVAGVITATLPAVATSAGREIEALDWTDHAAASNITIAAQPGETVNGLASIVINTNGGGCVLRCDGVVWRTKHSTV